MSEKSPKTQKRSELTKKSLKEATLETIHEVGWAKATSAAIADRAGVSRGAQTHHYPTKAELLAAAAEESVQLYREEFEAGITAIDPSTDQVRQIVDFLWELHWKSSLASSWLELVVASRTDPELAELAASVDRQITETILEVASGLLPNADDAQNERFVRTVRFGVFAMRGMMLDHIAQRDDAVIESYLDEIHDHVMRSLS